LNQIFCFSVPTESLPHQKNSHWDKLEEHKYDTELKLVRGTNMLKLVDEDYLKNYNSTKQEEPAEAFKHVTPIY
jgi:hypothetical protein